MVSGTPDLLPPLRRAAASLPLTPSLHLHPLLPLFPPVAMMASPAMSDWVLSELTFVGMAHNMEYLVSLNPDLALDDDEAFTMKYIGGLRLSLNFWSSADVSKFLSIYSDWFSEFSGDGSLLDRFDRLAWVKVVGLPLRLWDRENFSRIAGRFGRVIIPSETTLEAKDVSFGRFCILTDRRNRIEEEIPVVFEGNVMKIGVTEYDECWSPIKLSSQNILSFPSDSDDDDDDEDGISDTMMEEEDKSDDGNDDHEFSDPVSVADKDDLEKGEFRMDDVEVVAESKFETDSDGSISQPTNNPLPAAVELGVEVLIQNDVHAFPTCVHAEERPVFVFSSLEPSAGKKHSISRNSGGDLADSGKLGSFGPLNDLIKKGCFGPFSWGTNDGVPKSNCPKMQPNQCVGRNFVGSFIKRRRIHASSVDHNLAHSTPYVDLNDNFIPPAIPGNVFTSPLPQSPSSPSFDLNSSPHPSLSFCSKSGFVIPSPPPPLSEIEHTADRSDCWVCD
ncbi:hypothetical protein L1887_00391 [Cichorium endivia]|nr:hypothetical protein L1887_00391 [Cichorium endivia]